MMAEIREEAQRIKAELAAKKEEQELEDNGDSLSTLTGRKFAQPKGKTNRYSEVHMAEFKKMDSIAGHPSAFRAQSGKITPVTKTLKRTQSKANLNDREGNDAKPTLKRTQSKANLNDRDGNVAKPTIKLVSQSSRLENEAPAKRARQLDARDTSFARPSSRDANSQIPSKPSTPTVARTTNFLDSITTPTKASLARATSIKQMGTPLHSMPRSPSKIALTPGLVKSATMNNVGGLMRSETTHKFASKMKSILRRPTASPEKARLTAPSSIPPFIKSPSRPNLNKELPFAPTTPETATPQLTRPKSVKHVNFTPNTMMKDAAQQSPTPLKSGIPRSKSFANLNSVAYPALPSPSKAVAQPKEKPKEKPAQSTVNYPSLPKEFGMSPMSSRPQLQQPEPVPGVFTFTSDQTIKFGTPPHTFGPSPGQASIRKVRQSIFSNSMPGSFPEGNKENKVPAVAHGIPNKKRARAAASDDEAGDDDLERSPKKQKGVAAEGQMLMAPKLLAEKMAPKTKIPSPAKRGGLSLARLKQLAMPKSRK